MDTKFKLLLSQSNDPWFNLATEDWLFQEMGDYDHILFVWRNCESVIIGRSQNPWLECNLERMQQNDVQLARRQSGGGAVFHDLGNLNFTFLSAKENYRRRDNFDILLTALKQLELEAEVSGRNDVVIKEDGEEGRKISGSAFRENTTRAFHHGTLLIETDLTKLQNYLNPNKKKLLAKGVQSVKSRVANLQEFKATLSFETVAESLFAAFREFHGVSETALRVEILRGEELAKIIGLNEYYQKMQSWEWLYGQTLHFTHRFEERLSWACIDVQLEVEGGMVQDARVYSDSLYPELITAIQSSLVGVKYHPAVISNRLHEVRVHYPVYEAEVMELEQWLLGAFV